MTAMRNAMTRAGIRTAPKQPVSPWNPSRRAMARVKNPIEPPFCCPNCGARVVILRNASIYGRDYGEWPWAYVCENFKQGCDTYVGMHPFTNIPLGTMANGELRHWRKMAKSLFTPLYEGGPYDRTAAYHLLAHAMKLPVGETHFGWFDIEQCKQAIAALKKIRNLK